MGGWAEGQGGSDTAGQAVSLGADSWAAGGSPSGAGAQCSEDLVGGSTRQL